MWPRLELSSDCGDALDLNQEIGDVLIAPAFSPVLVEGNICFDIDCERYSSLEKLLKFACCVKRFVRNLKARVRRGECLEEGLTVAEWEEAITPSHLLYGRNIARRERLKLTLSHFKKRRVYTQKQPPEVFCKKRRS